VCKSKSHSVFINFFKRGSAISFAPNVTSAVYVAANFVIKKKNGILANPGLDKSSCSTQRTFQELIRHVQFSLNHVLRLAICLEEKDTEGAFFSSDHSSLRVRTKVSGV